MSYQAWSDRKPTTPRYEYRSGSGLNFPVFERDRVERIIVSNNGSPQLRRALGQARMRTHDYINFLAGRERQMLQHDPSERIDRRFDDMNAHNNNYRAEERIGRI